MTQVFWYFVIAHIVHEYGLVIQEVLPERKNSALTKFLVRAKEWVGENKFGSPPMKGDELFHVIVAATVPHRGRLVEVRPNLGTEK